jgi:flagellar basal-body rod protein FlgG
MDRGIYPIVAAAIGQERHLDLLTSNLANIQTTGYRREKALFKTVLAQSVAGSAVPKAASDKLFPRLDRTYTDWKEGVVGPTGNPLDMALNGEGFFVVQTPHGEEYTRSGSFVLNENRELSTRDGAQVMGQNGPLRIPVGKMTVNDKGEILVNDTVAGTVKVVKFPEMALAVRVGERFVTSQDVSPAPDTKVVGESLEGSNVNPVEEFARLIEITRHYESIQKVVQAMDDLERQAASEIGRPV